MCFLPSPYAKECRITLPFDHHLGPALGWRYFVRCIRTLASYLYAPNYHFPSPTVFQIVVFIKLRFFSTQMPKLVVGNECARGRNTLTYFFSFFSALLQLFYYIGPRGLGGKYIETVICFLSNFYYYVIV